MSAAPSPTKDGKMIRGLVALLLALAVLGAVAAAPASAAWDFAPGGATMTLHDDAGNPVTQAGSHPNLTTALRFTTNDAGGGTLLATGTPKDVHVDLPAGLLGDPGALPTCSQAELTARGAEVPNVAVCPAESQVGEVELDQAPCQDGTDCRFAVTGPRKFPVYNMETGGGEPARFGFNIELTTVILHTRLVGARGNTVRVSATSISESASVIGLRLTFYGVPADHNGPPSTEPGDGITPVYENPGTGPRVPFIRNSTSCDSARRVDVEARSWQTPETAVTTTIDLPQATGCDQLNFKPSIDVRPATTQADAPSAYDITVRNEQNADPDGLAAPDLEAATVVLPEGVAISPSSANGLGACADAAIGFGTDAEPSCPFAARIGTVAIDTPLLADPLEGEVLLRDPQPGELFRLALVARGSGVLIKLPGVARPDPRTGRITAVFTNTPQLPFAELRLRLKGGSRAPLVNPRSCGVKTTTTSLVPWGGATKAPTSAFTVTGCTDAFAPTLEAGTLNPLAGAFSPFTLTVRRADGQPDLASLAVALPPGLLGIVAGVPQCGDAQAGAGTCGAESQVGTTTVEAGSGDTPFALPGRVFLAGPYKGAPFSLSVVVRAIAGPFDLGTVVVRAPINVDAANAKLAVASDPLPTILEGVPLRLRTINITMGRPGFMFNPTSCAPMSIGATLGAPDGRQHTASVPYRASGCANLPLRPQLRMALVGSKETTDGRHPGLTARLTQTRGEAGLRGVSVKLPLSLALDPDNAQALCTPEQATARACPAGSIVGRASAVTPALNRPLSGPVYFVEGRRTTATGQVRRTLPRLWLALQGEVPLDLWASSEVVDDHLVTTFASVPDAPIAAFDLRIDGGRNGILAANTNICAVDQASTATFDGQNGRRTTGTVRMDLPCRFGLAQQRRVGQDVQLVVSGLGRGKVTLSGRGVRTTSRTLKSASVARLTARLTTGEKRTLRRRGRLSRRVTVTFAPAGGGKARRTTTTVTFRR